MCGQKVVFLGAIAKLRKAAMNLVTPVCPSARMEQLGSNWSDLKKKSDISVFLENLSRKFKFSLQSDKNKGCFI